MSTVGTEWTARLAAQAEKFGVEFVDAPVSGSEEPAKQAQLLVLASGSDSARPRVQPVFDAIGRQTLWLGPAGMGSRLKLVFNHWLAYLAEGMASTLALSRALGLDPQQFVDAVGTGPLAAPYAMGKAKAMLSGDFEPGFPLRLAVKDVDLALDAATAHGLDLPTTAELATRWRATVAAGHGDEDVAAIITTLSRQTQDL
jgi:3-hydroxyisobutyrate dehydrogenase